MASTELLFSLSARASDMLVSGHGQRDLRRDNEARGEFYVNLSLATLLVTTDRADDEAALNVA